MSIQPLFSIVIPTYNRAHLVSYALHSVLENQLIEQCEVIISDNASTDNTYEVLLPFVSENVKYVRVSNHLTMADHWEFVLNQTSGEYITYLCDDDAWTPHVLSSVIKIIQRDPKPKLIGMFRGRYYASNVWWPELANSIAVTPFTGKIIEVNAHESLKQLFKRYESMRMPKMFNSFIHRDLLVVTYWPSAFGTAYKVETERQPVQTHRQRARDRRGY